MSFRPDHKPIKLSPSHVPNRVYPLAEDGDVTWISIGSAMFRMDAGSKVIDQTRVLLTRRTVRHGKVTDVDDVWPSPAPTVRMTYVSEAREHGQDYAVYRYRKSLRYVPMSVQPPKYLYASVQSLLKYPRLVASGDVPEPVYDRIGRQTTIPPKIRRHVLSDSRDLKAASMLLLPTAMPADVVDRESLVLETAEAVEDFESVRATPEFRRWFEGASDAVREPDGSPKVFYRGQTSGSGALQSRFSMDSFTSSPDIASMYAANQRSLNFEGGVTPVYLDIKNPLVISEGVTSLYDFLGYLGYWRGSSLFADYESPDHITDEEVLRLFNYLINRDKYVTSTFPIPKLRKAFEGVGPFKYVVRKPSALLDEDDDEYDDDDDFSLQHPLVSLRDSFEYAYRREDQEREAMRLVVDVYALVDAPVTKRVLQRLGYDGVIHKDTFTSEDAPRKLLGKELEDVAGIEYGEEQYDEDLDVMSYDFGHQTIRPLSRSQVWSLISNTPYTDK